MHRYLWWCIVRIYLEGVLVCNIFLLLYCIASPPKYDTVLVENDPLDILPIYGNFKVKRKMTVKQSYFMTIIWGKRRRRTVKFEPRSEVKREAIYVVLGAGKRTNSESHKESNPRFSDFALRCSATQLQKKTIWRARPWKDARLYTIIITLQWILTNQVDATNRLRYRWIWCCGLVQQPCNSWPPPASKFYHLCRWRHCDKTLLWIHLMSHSLTSLECQNFSTNLPFYTADSNIDSMSATGRTEIPIVSYFCWPVVLLRSTIYMK